MKLMDWIIIACLILIPLWVDAIEKPLAMDCAVIAMAIAWGKLSENHQNGDFDV